MIYLIKTEYKNYSLFMSVMSPLKSMEQNLGVIENIIRLVFNKTIEDYMKNLSN